MQSKYHPKHYCGVFGVFGHPEAAQLTYYGLYALQHRGQESAGIVTCADGKFHKHVGMGLVPHVFKQHNLDALKGSMACGHTRYSTTGGSSLGNAQPLTVDCLRGQIAVAHNGNLTNAALLRDELERRGLVFQTTVDSEIIIMMLAQPTMGQLPNTIVQTLRRIEGAYSLVMMTEKELIGARDPFGFRPLCLGKTKKGGAWVLSSETTALDLIEAEFVRDVEPGEVVVINDQGLTSIQAFPEHHKRALCIFEYVYFARPDSLINGRTVYEVRKEMGRQLAREHNIEADIVIPVPDSGVCAAMGYSEQAKIPYEMAFIRNHYVGRSFLQPTQLIRDFNVRVKLNLIENLVKGKRVVIVDDSIVRGTTCKSRVTTLKEAGAAEVHVAVSCPPHMHPCFYGIDFPDPKELMATQKTVDEIRDFLNADSLHYLSAAGMIKSTGQDKSAFCTACYDGKYPVPFDAKLNKSVIENRKRQAQTIGEAATLENRQIKLPKV